MCWDYAFERIFIHFSDTIFSGSLPPSIPQAVCFSLPNEENNLASNPIWFANITNCFASYIDALLITGDFRYAPDKENNPKNVADYISPYQLMYEDLLNPHNIFALIPPII